MDWKKPLLVFALVGVGVLLGGLAALEPLLAVALPVAGLIGFYFMARLALFRSPAYLLVGLLGLLQFMNSLRDTWFEPLAPVRELRIPVTFLALGLLVLYRPTHLLSRRVIAAIGVPVLYAVWLIVSGSFGINPARSAFYGLWIVVVIVLLGGVAALFPRPVEFWRRYMDALFWAGVPLVLVSLAVIAAGRPEAETSRWLEVGEVAAYTGFFERPGMMSYSGCMLLGALFARAELREDPRLSRIEWVLVGLASLAVMLTLARTGLLGVVGGTLFHLRRRLRDLVRTMSPRRLLGLATGALVGLALALSTESGRGTVDRLLSTGETTAAGEEQRVVIWGSFLRAYLDRPVFGIGFSNSTSGLDFVAGRYTTHTFDAHSTVISLLATSGVLGTLLGLAVLAGAWRGAHHPHAGVFRSSAAALLFSVGPYYLFETSGSGPGQGGFWPLWAVLMTASVYLGIPRPGRVPAARPPELQLVRPLGAGPGP